MLKKLLKYDFQAVFRYWWIVAISSIAIAFVGGGCEYILALDKDFPYAIAAFVGLVNFFVKIGLLLLCLSTIVFIFIRFYQNFFTDEGYLTFTLPISKATLINSKIIMSISLLVMTFVLYFVEILIIYCIGYSDVIFTADFWNELRFLWNETWNYIGEYTIVYLIEFLIIALLTVAFNILFMYCCITFASVVTKRAKVLAAIGIYYGAYSLFSFVVQIFCLFGIGHLYDRMYFLSADTALPIIATILLGIICSIFILCLILYTLLYWMIDRKLNLS